ncbi:hypothetical protein [Niabella drilacis]|uniref:hypothetical protein n=1 Tax=Niabella drilacis (strain DSM 25811 / CCM 8410 / CCUG 62505 / LMG 26954 / E90) TaxID=1285928 RepID=UPI000B86A2A1|nr:hypothetical protein [Niabella drilacis]
MRCFTAHPAGNMMKRFAVKEAARLPAGAGSPATQKKPVARQVAAQPAGDQSKRLCTGSAYTGGLQSMYFFNKSTGGCSGNDRRHFLFFNTWS